MRRGSLLSFVFFFLTGAAVAQAPMVSVEVPECFPEEYTQVVYATVEPEIGGTIVRLFFRWDDHGAMYFVDMEPVGDGRYWGIPAHTEPQNEMVEFYVAVMKPDGTVLSRSEGTSTSPVRERCKVEMTAQQIGTANNLVIGETVEAQEGRRVLGFLCDGIVTRINYLGIKRPDEICRGCVIPWWVKEEYIAPAVTTLGIPLIIDSPDPSPSRP